MDRSENRASARDSQKHAIELPQDGVLHRIGA
jgi:hypothetical protein